jgi:hypothetical protein
VFKQLRFLLLLLFVINIESFSQNKVTISGYVKDARNGELLIGATVRVKDAKIGARTNAYGFYSISLPKGKYTILTSYVGYDNYSKDVDIQLDTKLEIELKQSSKTTQEVVVTSQKEDNNITEIEMSTIKVEMAEIKKIPALLGEVDVIRSIQLLPGVSTVGEGATGFNVRGGSIDQNLILLDEAPIYNSSHLFGFFSVFNPDAVKDVKLVKGGIPAEYGGRLSSILDVRLKEGDNKEFDVTGGIGLIFSRLSVEGPIVKDKGSFIIAARRSYIDVLAKPFLSGDLKDAQFNFYDLTLKANYSVSDNDKLYLSAYFGRDVFGAGFKFNWGNYTTTLRWNHLFSDKLFLNSTFFVSDYDYSLQFGNTNDDVFRNDSRIQNYSFKPDFTFYLNPDNTMKFGGQTTFFKFTPGLGTFSSQGLTNNISLQNRYGLESAIYLDNEQKLTDDLTIQYGLRLSSFQYMGSGTAYEFNDTTAGLRRTPVSQKDYGLYDVISSYMNLEPRFSANYLIDGESSIKLSYNRMSQYLHLVSNTTASTPLDVWTPTTNNIPPEIADQVALGYFKNFNDNEYEASIETYYKQSTGQVDYINGANLFLNQLIEGDLLIGKGRAYGVELYLRKRKGALNGWISYTLARSERLVDGINGNDWFANRFDRLHNLNIVANYDLTTTWNFSANFVFQSGTPATFPTNRIEVQGNVIPHNSFDRRNNYRLPAYHRLDLSATYRPEKNPDSKFEHYWVFSIYNAYNRRNPFSVFFQQNPDNAGQTEAIRYSVIGSIVPSIAWNFSF